MGQVHGRVGLTGNVSAVIRNDAKDQTSRGRSFSEVSEAISACTDNDKFDKFHVSNCT